MDLREIEEKIWFQGRKTESTKLDLVYVGQGTDQEGPGFYFSDHSEDASRYAAPTGTIIMGRIRPRRIASSEEPADRKTIQDLIERAPDLEHTLTNWDQNPKRALKAAIDSILRYNPLEKDAFQQVWIDFYKTEPVEYLDALVALGFDGHVPTGSWGALHHFVLYNPKAFRLEDSYPYAESAVEIDSATGFLKWADKAFKEMSDRGDIGEYIKDLAEEFQEGGFDDEDEDVTQTDAQYKAKYKKLRANWSKKLKGSGNKAIVYRHLAVHKENFPKLLDYIKNEKVLKDQYGMEQGLGIYWSYDKKGAESYWGNGEIDVMLEAEVALDQIDWGVTIAINMMGEGDSEKEIRLNEGAPLKVTNVWVDGKLQKDLKNKMAEADAMQTPISQRHDYGPSWNGTAEGAVSKEQISMKEIPHRFPDMFEEYGSDDTDPMYRVSITRKGKEIAWAEFGYHPGEAEYVAFSTEVDPKFRRQGLATKMYDYFEKKKGVRLVPFPGGHSEDAKKFWRGRTTAAARNPMGWISPGGDWVNTGDPHFEGIADHLFPDEVAEERKEYPDDEPQWREYANRAYNDGWLSVGHAGDLNVAGLNKILGNPREPAVQALIKLLKDSPSDKIYVEGLGGSDKSFKGEYDLPRFLKTGRWVKYNKLAAETTAGKKSFHGSPHHFKKFSPPKDGVNYGVGIYFTDDQKEAHRYATQHDGPGYQYEVDLDLKKPFDVRSPVETKKVASQMAIDWIAVQANEDWKLSDTGLDATDRDNYYAKLTLTLVNQGRAQSAYAAGKEVRRALEALGYDSIVDPRKQWYVVWNPEQVKILDKKKVKAEEEAEAATPRWDDRVVESIMCWLDNEGCRRDSWTMPSGWKLPKKFRKYDGWVYRGVGLTKEQLDAIKKNKPIDVHDYESWTKDSEVAHRFAFDVSEPYGVVFRFKPAPGQILADLDTILKDPEFREIAEQINPHQWAYIEQIEHEAEVILGDVPLKNKMIQKIMRLNAGKRRKTKPEGMRECPHCETKIYDDNLEFCPECGKPVEVAASVTASPDSIRREFRDLYESEEFYDDEFLDYYDGEPEKAREWFQMAYEGFRNRMQHWHWGTNGVRCWREISVPKGRKVNLKQLGGSWSYRKAAAHAWYGESGKKFIFEAEIPEAAIDRDVTLRNNLVNLDEEEIRTYDHQTVYLYAVWNQKGEKVKEFNPPLETKTGSIDLFGGSMLGEKAEAGGFYFWDDQDGPLYQTPPNEDKGSDQRTMPQQPTDWPSIKLEAKAEADKMFDRWYKAFGDDQGLRIALNRDPYNDEDPIDRDEARRWFDRRLRNIQNELKEAKRGQNFSIYRCIAVDSDWLEKLKAGEIKKLGHHWTISRDIAPYLCGGHGGKAREGQVVLEALCPASKLDIMDALNPGWSDEWEEFEVGVGQINLVCVWDHDMKNVLWKPDKPQRMAAADSDLSVEDFVGVVTRVAERASLADPHMAYMECSYFSEAVKEMADTYGVPAELWYADAVAQHDYREIRKGEVVPHLFVQIGKTVYDFTSRQIDPDSDFPAINPQYKNARKVKHGPGGGQHRRTKFYMEEIFKELGGEAEGSVTATKKMDVQTMKRAIDWLFTSVRRQTGIKKMPAPEIVEALKPFRPKKPMTLYRGLGTVEVGEWHEETGLSSWTDNKEVAEKFAGNNGTVLQLRAQPDQCLVDVNIASSEQALLRAGYTWEDLKLLRPERFYYPEHEIILLPGSFEVKLSKGKSYPTFSAKPKYPTEEDYEDAWAVMKHVYDMETTDEYEQQDLEDMGEQWRESLGKAKMKTWKVRDAAKKFQIMDHGRRIEGEELENPIIVAVVGKQYIVLDGSHRLITKFERGDETIDALMVPMNWASELTAMDGEMLATITASLEFLSAPAVWNGRSEIISGVRVGPKTYLAKKDLKTFIDTYVQIADEGLKDEIDAATTDDDIPEDFYRQNQDLIYFNDLTFRTYRPNDMMFETIMMALLTRRPLPQKVRVILYAPARDKTYLVKDLLQKGEHLLQSSVEDEEADWSHLKSIRDIEPIRSELAQAAQKPYDQWEQDQDGMDPELGPGGICHLIVDEILHVLDRHGFVCTSMSLDSEVHVVTVLQVQEGVYILDIPYGIYEQGGGYNWKKIPGVQFESDDITLRRVFADPAEFKQYEEG